MRSVPDVVLANVDSGVAATTFPPVTIYEPVIRLHGMKWQYAILLFWLLGTAVCVFCIASRYYGLIRRLRAASVPIDRQTVEIYRSIVVDLQIARPPTTAIGRHGLQSVLGLGSTQHHRSACRFFQTVRCQCDQNRHGS